MNESCPSANRLNPRDERLSGDRLGSRLFEFQASRAFAEKTYGYP
jgi:hypothetical protein